MTADWALIGAITSWITYPLTIALQIFIIKKDYDQRQNSQNKILGQKWLKIWSIATMVSCTLQLAFYLFHKIPYICLYTYRFQTPLYTLSGVLLTYYQISRLQYCFSVDNIHSNKFGISKYVFIILYFIGFTLPIFTVISTSYGQDVITADYLGCHWIIYPEYIKYSVPIIISYYVFYDLMVLGIYIYKIHQIRKRTAFKNEDIYQRINFILHKIQLLTIIYEIKAILIIISTFFVSLSWFSLAVLLPILNCVDAVLSVITIYLMLEHNNSTYMILLLFLKNKDLHCCCKNLVNSAIEYHQDIPIKLQTKSDNNSDKQQQQQTNDSVYDTQDISVKLDHEIYQSELTVQETTAPES